MEKIYLDYAASTPVDKRVIKEMTPFWFKKPGNSSSLHSFGQEAFIAIEKARSQVASLMHANPEEIVFTSSATESNNLAIKGVAQSYSKKGKHIIISSIEHACIQESSKWLEKKGFEVTRIKVDGFGFINIDDIKKAIRKDTVLVSIMHANNEIGTIQPIKEIGAICREMGVLFHTDAAQSLGKIPIDVNKMNIDLLTASSHKMYGPKGVACLFIRRGVNIEPILHGGGHEEGLRSSTMNSTGIVGFGRACEICAQEMKVESKKQISLRDKLINGVLKIKGSRLNGHSKKRLPNNANFGFNFIEGESLIMQLDFNGIYASTGSACSSAKLQASHVLLAIGLRPEQAHGSLRISLGRWTTEKEIDRVLKVLPKVVKKLRDISPFKR
ncbi:MAG: cysteine desulfurase NifS [Patescibacteria group bacterium]